MAAACGSDDGGPGARYDNRSNGAAAAAAAGRGNAAASGGRGGSGGSANLQPTNGGAKAGTGVSMTDPAINDPNVCASAQVTATRVTPTVYFVIDGSGSMAAEFGGNASRWQVLRQALVGDAGVITQLESVVRFGTSIYSNNDPMMCPAMSNVAPQLSNLAPIRMGYPEEETGGGTPTGEALQIVVDSLPNYSSPDVSEPAPIIILATDGEPNGCGGNQVMCDWADFQTCLNNVLAGLSAAPVTYDTTLAAVRSARDKSIPVWVISLADGLNNIPELQTTANIGAGLTDDANPGATIYSPQNPNDLVQTLAQLLGAVVTCDVKLNGMLQVDRACEGSVTMNGQFLNCNDAQGWKPIDATHIELQGAACEKFKSDPSVLLAASFPCDVIIPQ